MALLYISRIYPNFQINKMYNLMKWMRHWRGKCNKLTIT